MVINPTFAMTDGFRHVHSVARGFHTIDAQTYQNKTIINRLKRQFTITTSHYFDDSDRTTIEKDCRI